MKVRLSAAFLRSTGQFAGYESHRQWETVSHDCEICRDNEFVAVNQASEFEPYGPRHIRTANLEHKTDKGWKRFDK